MGRARRGIDKTDVDALQKLMRRNSKVQVFHQQVANFPR